VNADDEGLNWDGGTGEGKLLLQTWQSSESWYVFDLSVFLFLLTFLSGLLITVYCDSSGAPDNTVGPIRYSAQEGSCGITPVRSFQLICG
jgi:hypothetical protein